jgi:hypothetical protein
MGLSTGGVIPPGEPASWRMTATTAAGTSGIEEESRMLAERWDRIFKRVNSSPAYAQLAYDDPVHRVMCVMVTEVLDLISDLDLFQVYKMMQEGLLRRSSK